MTKKKENMTKREALNQGYVHNTLSAIIVYNDRVDMYIVVTVCMSSREESANVERKVKKKRTTRSN